MKRLIFSVLVVICVPLHASTPCDTCDIPLNGGYMGILPQFKRHFIGIRYDALSITGSHSHMGSTAQTSQIYYHTWNIWAGLKLHKRVDLFVGVPIHYFMQNISPSKREVGGPGDIWTLVQYQLLRSKDLSKKKMKYSLMVGGGIKLPTGRYNAYDTLGFYDRNMQPGTGSWDFLVSSTYTMRWNAWGLNTNVNARFSTMNPDNYLYGHQMNAGVKGFYWGKGEKISVLMSAGFLYDFKGKDNYLRQTLPNSGGHALYGTTSIDLYLKRFTIGTEFKVPIYTDLAKGTIKTGAQIMGQVAVMF